MGVNKFIGLGNLTRSPELTYTQGGTAVAKFTIAVNETWYDKSTGEKKEKTEFIRVVYFGKSAETISRYMTKGSQIYVEGRIQTSQYEKDGTTRYSTEIAGSVFQFVGGKGQQVPQQKTQQPVQQGFQPPAQQGFQQPMQQGQQQGFQPPGDGIPF